MEKRCSKKTDQMNIEKAFNILINAMKSDPEIEPTLWAGAVWSVLVEGYINSGMSYELFCKEWDKIKIHYKSWWNE